MLAERREAQSVIPTERLIFDGYTQLISGVRQIERQYGTSRIQNPAFPELVPLEAASPKIDILTDYVVQRLTRNGVIVEPVNDQSWPKARNGEYIPCDNRIRYRKELSPLHKLKTIVHEASHMVRAGDEEDFVKSDMEIVAEASAFIALHIHGLNTRKYSFPYVIWWAKSTDIVRWHKPEILETAKDLLTYLGTPAPAYS